MVCKKCGSNNMNIIQEQVGGKVRTKNTGCLWGIGRMILIVCTLGLWLLVGSRKETSHISFKHQVVAICQNCGNKQKV